MPDIDIGEFLRNTAQAFITGEPDDAQDRFAEFVNRHAEDEAVTASVMNMIDELDNVRGKIAFDAVVAAVLNTPRASPMHQEGLEKWDTLIEHIAKEDIFRALDWATLPCLYSDQFESLHAAGLKKWTELLDRAAAINFNRALQHARSMEDSDPTRPFSTTARLAANLIESRKPAPPAPAPATI